MRVLVDCSLLNAGGGIQVGLSFIGMALQSTNVEIGVVSSLEMSRQISAGDKRRMLAFHAPTYKGVLSRATLAARCRSIEKEISPDVTFSVFGPAYWQGQAPRLQGFAIPRLVYPEYCGGLREGILDRVWERLRDEVKRSRLMGARDSDYWVVETEVVKERLCVQFGIDTSRVSVIPNTYNAAFAKEGVGRADDLGPARILVPSAYYVHKNLEIIPQVAVELQKVCEREFVFELTLKQDHPAAIEISGRAEALGVRSAVQFLGEVPLADLPGFYKRASVAFLPTLLECSTAVYPESFVSETPLVTSDREFARALCGRGALFANPLSPAHCAELLKSAICDKSTRETLIVGGREALKQNYLTPEEKWTRQLELLERLAFSRRSRRGHRGGSLLMATTVPSHTDSLHVYSNNHWCENLVPYTPAKSEREIEVLAICNLIAIGDLYFVPKRSLSLLQSYLLDIGIRNTWRKVVSRWAEGLRNTKVLSVGIGRLLPVQPGAAGLVCFVATAHPEVCTRLAINKRLIWPISDRFLAIPAKGGIIRAISEPNEDELAALSAVSGWSEESCVEFPAGLFTEVEKAARSVVARIDWDRGEILHIPRSNQVPILPNAQLISRKKVSASLFGYGNYAKSVIIPNCRRDVSFDVVHEIDPTQLGAPVAVTHKTTSPDLLQGENTDVVFVASYHHTHARLACAALRSGKDVVLEKPLVTKHEQITELLEAMEQSGKRLFACFQRRYSRLNEFIRADLKWTRGMAISYHCIVHEVPLPARHWYRWPVSRSRILSNGCHWIDHFLYLNDFVPVARTHVFSSSETTIVCALELENGASFSMVLTEQGSSRIGVQDHVQLRAGSCTIVIDNGARYSAETTDGKVRNCSVHRMESYERMYKTIARRLRNGETGDTISAVKATCSVVLDVEARLNGR